MKCPLSEVQPLFRSITKNRNEERFNDTESGNCEDPTERTPSRTSSLISSSSGSSSNNRYSNRKLLLVCIFAVAISIVNFVYSFQISGVEVKDTLKTTISAAAANSATGTLFANDIIRTFPGPRGLVRSDEQFPPIAKITQECKRWGVVTTIFDPTDAIARVANLPSWCLVIVPDTKTPHGYMDKLAKLQQNNLKSSFRKMNEDATDDGDDDDDDATDDEARAEDVVSSLDNVFYFSIEMQQEWEDIEGPFGSFVRSIPWKHFCRKNLGYLIAILYGAKFIFDFDDDNFIKLDNDGTPMEILPEGEDMSQMKLNNVTVVMQGPNAFNHHPIMGASIEDSWARGFPLALIQDKHTQGKVAYIADIPFAANNKEIGVIQFLADGNPDIDAIHRISKPLPMTYPLEKANSVLVPAHAYSPYNAQATIHTKNAFWAMLLPSTVPGRVSDIWRSYFAQCIFADTGLQLIFSPPKIVQERNEHNYLGDFNAEQDLYDKSGKLIEHLSQWDSDHDTVPERMLELWIDMYERGYIEIDDVYAVQMWLGALAQVGYEFPPLKRRHRNVAVMGQFNYADKPSIVRDVIYWTQKNRERFDTVVAAGPFSRRQMKKFEDNSIIAVSNHIDGDHDYLKGYFSPLDNLKNTLLSFKDSSKIEGVIYTHDDGILNVTELSRGEYPFPTDQIIAINSNARKRYRIFPDGHLETVNKQKSFDSITDMYDNLPLNPWNHTVQPHCGGGQTKLAKDPASTKYQEDDGSILFLQYGQSDFMFVPTKYVNEFAEAAELHLKHKIWIECAFNTVADMVRRKAGASIRVINLCTKWGDERGSVDMMDTCKTKNMAMGFIHPLKLSKGYRTYSEMYERAQ